MDFNKIDLLPKIRNFVAKFLKGWPNPADEVIELGLRTLFILNEGRPKTGPISPDIWGRSQAQNLVLEMLDLLEKRQPLLGRPMRDKYIFRKSTTAVCFEHHLSESTFFRIRNKSLDYMARVIILQEMSNRLSRARLQQLYLPAPSYDDLFGVEETRDSIVAYLKPLKYGQICFISGIGGIGKTALADAAVRQLLAEIYVERPVWVKPDSNYAESPHGNPDLLYKTIIRTICREIFPKSGIRPYAEQLEMVLNELNKNIYLIVIDNLELEEDTDKVIEELEKIGSISKFVVTSRTNKTYQGEISTVYLGELSESDAFEFFLAYTASTGIKFQSREQKLFEEIYRLTGGNPLAIKIVIGFLNVIPISQVLIFLQRGQMRSVTEMYRRVYQKAWALIGEDARHTLLSMPLVGSTGCTMETLVGMTSLPEDRIVKALDELIRRSLVESKKIEEEERFCIHQLTETFLYTDIIGEFD